MRRIRKLRMEIIEWKDHASNSGWADPHEVVKEPRVFLSVGWVWVETDECVTLAGAVDPENIDISQVGCTQLIIKSCIVSRRILKIRQQKLKRDGE